MVQEVESLNPELKLSALTHLEVLEQRQVACPEPRSKNFRQNGGAVRPRNRRQSKAVPIDELVGAKILSGVARQNRPQRNLVGAVDRLSVVRGTGVDILLFHRRRNE